MSTWLYCLPLFVWSNCLQSLRNTIVWSLKFQCGWWALDQSYNIKKSQVRQHWADTLQKWDTRLRVNISDWEDTLLFRTQREACLPEGYIIITYTPSNGNSQVSIIETHTWQNCEQLRKNANAMRRALGSQTQLLKRDEDWITNHRNTITRLTESG